MTAARRPAAVPEVSSGLGRCNTGRLSETNCFRGSSPIRPSHTCCKAPVQITPRMHTPQINPRRLLALMSVFICSIITFLFSHRQASIFNCTSWGCSDDGCWAEQLNRTDRYCKLKGFVSVYLVQSQTEMYFADTSFKVFFWCVCMCVKQNLFRKRYITLYNILYYLVRFSVLGLFAPSAVWFLL